MIRVRDARVVWDEYDIHRMSKVLGAEAGAQLWAPLQPSIIKSAAREGVRLSDRSARLLARANEDRVAIKLLRQLEDVVATNATEKKLWPHQRVDLHLMRVVGLDAYLLAHQPGVGKTAESSLWALDDPDTKRILVVCPNTAKWQWARELLRWTRPVRKLPVTVLDGTTKAQEKLARTARGWVIAPWHTLSLCRVALLEAGWDTIIADEAHNASNRDTVRASTLHRLVARRRIALTAHPYTKNPSEVWSILHFLYPQLYSSYWRFFFQHVDATPRHFGGYDIHGARDSRMLRWELAPFTLRRTKLSLGWRPPVRIVRHVELTKKMESEYADLRRKLFVELEGIDGGKNVLMVPNVLARITRLRQYLVDPGLLNAAHPSVKYPAVLEIMQELDGPPVIFTEFREAAVRLQEYLKKQRVGEVGLIAGGAGDRDRTRRAFLEGKLAALVVVSSAGGESLNLGKYGYVIYLDLPWHPRGYEQTEGRVDRPEEGSGNLVQTTAYRIIVSNSYEQRREDRLEQLHHDFTGVFTADNIRTLFHE